MCFVKATGLFGLRKVGCDISAQREITWAASGEESWVTSGEEGRAAPLQSRAEQAASQLSTEASDKREQSSSSWSCDVSTLGSGV